MIHTIGTCVILVSTCTCTMAMAMGILYLGTTTEPISSPCIPLLHTGWAPPPYPRCGSTCISSRSHSPCSRACTRVSTPRRSRPETLGLDPDPYPPILHSTYWLTLNTPVHQCTQWSPLLHTSTPVVQRTQYCTPHHTACHAEWRKSRYPK